MIAAKMGGRTVGGPASHDPPPSPSPAASQRHGRHPCLPTGRRIVARLAAGCPGTNLPTGSGWAGQRPTMSSSIILRLRVITGTFFAAAIARFFSGDISPFSSPTVLLLLVLPGHRDAASLDVAALCAFALDALSILLRNTPASPRMSTSCDLCRVRDPEPADPTDLDLDRARFAA